MSRGKFANLAHTKQTPEKPSGDFYSTPKSLVWKVEDVIKKEFDLSAKILEPCSGQGAISEELRKLGYVVEENDLQHSEGRCFLQNDWVCDGIITNPPFSLWDDFIRKAKSSAPKVMMIGRMNYLATNSRYTSGIWNHLKAVYCFNRYVDFQTPYRLDGMFHVGAMATAWFLWDQSYEGLPSLQIVDVQSFATLGAYKSTIDP